VLTERNRAVLYRRLSEMVGDEEAVREMLSNFPADDRDPPVTASMLGVTEANLRTIIAQQETRLIMWMVGTAIALAAVIVTAFGILT